MDNIVNFTIEESLEALHTSPSASSRSQRRSLASGGSVFTKEAISSSPGALLNTFCAHKEINSSPPGTLTSPDTSLPGTRITSYRPTDEDGEVRNGPSSTSGHSNSQIPNKPYGILHLPQNSPKTPPDAGPPGLPMPAWIVRTLAAVKKYIKEHPESLEQGFTNMNIPKPKGCPTDNVLLAFFERVQNNAYRCYICSKFCKKRKGRAIEHIRGIHLNHRPFLCNGRCGKVGCKERYPGSESLQAHTYRVRAPKRPCPCCGTLRGSHNLSKHVKKCMEKNEEAQADT